MRKKLRDFKLPIMVKKIVLLLFFIFIFDVLVANLGTSFLCERILFFSGKSRGCVLSDLLFLEGAMIFAIAAFVASGLSAFNIGKWLSLSSGSGGHTEHSRELRGERVRFGIVFMMIGGLLIGLSIVISTFLI